MQTDIIYELVERHMNLIAEDILSYLDETSLRNCESVSKYWYLVIREGKLWKRLYNRVCLKKPLLTTILQLREAKIQMQNDEFQFKKLFTAPKQLCKNWRDGKYSTLKTNLGEVKVSVFTMDAKRILLGVNSSVPPSIIVWNRWTLEHECLLVGSILARITDLALHGEVIFCSHSDGKIAVWNLLTQRVIMQIQDEGVPEWVYWVDLRVAHGFLVGAFNIHADPDEAIDFEDYTCITVWRICDPLSKMGIESREHIPNGMTVCHLASDDKYFAVFLESFDLVKFQLRSSSNFQNIIREVHIATGSRFDYHSGRLVTISIEERQMKVWDSETLTVKQSWPITLDCYVDDLSITCNHIILFASVQGVNKFIVWDLPSTTDGDTSPVKQSKELFQCEMNSEEFYTMDHDALLFKFDELQSLTISCNYPSPTTPLQSTLTRRDFL